MKENNSLSSLNAANPLAQRVLYNAQMPQDIQHDFSDLEHPPPISPLLQEGDSVVKLLAYSVHNLSPKAKKYQSVTLYLLTLIERNLSTFLSRMSKKYRNLGIADTTGHSFDNRIGVVVLPVSMMYVHEYKVPLAQLSEESLGRLTEEAKAQGAQFIGEIPGRYLQRGQELVAQYYLHTTDEETLSHIHTMIHPTQPLNEIVDVKYNQHWDKVRESTTKIRDESFTIFFGCQRDNCSWCLDATREPLIDEEMRKKTVRELSEIRESTGMLFTIYLLNWMHEIATELDDYSLEELQMANSFLDAANRIFDSDSAAASE